MIPEKKLDMNTWLALDRTRLAYDRTLMAWVRTSTSLITFGFSVYKFFQIQETEDHLRSHHLINSREFALIMISIGILSLVFAVWDYSRHLKRLKQNDFEVGRSLPAVVASLVSLLGVIAFLMVVFRQ